MKKGSFSNFCIKVIKASFVQNFKNMDKTLYDKDNNDINSNQTYKLNNNYLLNNNNKQNLKKNC